ncbi:3-deoxy-D-manno-octulosonic acid kinase [Kangiella sp.]|uniref:3-deoxy-D-manno-octulosonic acid kinase n=1 Tax=Kangiella sp. TaxID=1920245 RepID=UPI003A8DC7D0
MKIQQVDRNRFLVTTKRYRDKVTSDWFDAKLLAEQGAIIGHSTGRNTTWFFQQQDQQFVLRKYFRGGILSKWVEDSYFFIGLKRTRAYRELALLRKMRKKGLPVPDPVALMVEKNGFTYRASIIIGLIKNTQDLFHILRQRSLSADEWKAVGMLIKQFHDKGVYHSDLNIHNIMLDDQGQFWLIDFDKGRLIANNRAKLETNLARLQRSLRKELSKFPDFNWQESDWHHLVKGYYGD